MQNIANIFANNSAHLQELTFWWEKSNDSLSEPETSGENSSSVRIKILNETEDLDDISCHVSNEVGESDPCMVEVNLSLLVSRRKQQELVTIIIIAAAVCGTLLVISIITCLYCYKKSKTNKGENSISAMFHLVLVCHLLTN